MNAHDAFLTKKFSQQTQTEDSKGRQITLQYQSVDGIVEIMGAVEVNTNKKIAFIEFSLSEISEFQKLVETAAQKL